MFFHGNFALISPASLLQILCQERRSVLISAWRGSDTIQVQIDEGMIVGARWADGEGVEAVYQLLAWDCGQFRLEPNESLPLSDAFVADWEELVFEAARRRDEHQLIASPLIGSAGRRQLASLLVECPAIAGVALIGYDGRMLARVGIPEPLLFHITTLTGGLGAVSTALGSKAPVSLYVNGGHKLLLADCGAQTLVLAIPSPTARIGDSMHQLAAYIAEMQLHADSEQERMTPV
jgi:hypothetical protein